MDGQEDGAGTGTGAPAGGVGGAAPGSPVVPAAGAVPAGAAPAGVVKPVQSRLASGMPPEALTARLAREREATRRSLLAEIGGTDSAQVKAQLLRLQELEKKQAEAERANMSELDKMRADLAAANERATVLERERDEAKQAHQYEKHDQLVTGIAGRYVNPKAVRLARVEFAEHVKTLTESEKKAMTDRDASKWFAAYAKENPEFAIVPGTTTITPAAEVKKPAVRLLSNGSPARRVNPAGGAAVPAIPSAARGELPNGKTIRPGSNQASKAEVRAEFKKLGVNYQG